MPRGGTAHPIDDYWRGRVEQRLEELKKTKSWLARESKCPRSLISELLDGKRKQTTYLAEIHAALSWPPPMGPLLSRDDEELLGIAHELTNDDLIRFKERGLALREERKRKPTR